MLCWSLPGDSVVADGLWAALPEAEAELEAAGAACAEREKAEMARSAKVFAYIVSKGFKIKSCGPALECEKRKNGGETGNP